MMPRFGCAGNGQQTFQPHKTLLKNYTHSKSLSPILSMHLDFEI